MLTEEKLQNLINQLRLGIYNSDRYIIKSNVIIDKETNAKLHIYYFVNESEWIQTKIFKRWKEIKYKTPKYYITIEEIGEVEVSKELYTSYKTYFEEIDQKNRLTERLKSERHFGLE